MARIVDSFAAGQSVLTAMRGSDDALNRHSWPRPLLIILEYSALTHTAGRPSAATLSRTCRIFNAIGMRDDPTIFGGAVCACDIWVDDDARRPTN